MRRLKSFVVAVLAFVVLVAPSVVLADGRVALVVGNSTYAHIGRLPNTQNDATDMSAALRRLGFEVTTELDADRVELTDALRRFTRRSAGADVSLVFYAGHGIEMDGVNYLVPVDARLERDVDVRFETVTLDDLLVSTSGASLRLVILDACRNNPLARSMQRTAATRSVSGGSFGNLNEALLGDETLVAYAAAAGTTAADGRGRNSPYTAALLSHLENPLEILTLFRRVRAQVLASTNGAQRPHEYQSLVREHYLTGGPASGVAAATTAGASADPPRADPPNANIGEMHIVALRDLAEAGDAEAQTELGERYEHGRGVVRDYMVAVAWSCSGPGCPRLHVQRCPWRREERRGRGWLVRSGSRTGKCSRAVQPRRDVSGRSRGAAGLRGSCSLVQASGRTGRSRRGIHPRQHVP